MPDGENQSKSNHESTKSQGKAEYAEDRGLAVPAAAKSENESAILIQSTQIVDSFAEAFPLRFTRLVITAANEYWLKQATDSICGYGTSVIACDAEVGISRLLSSDETPDARVGAEVLLFAMGSENLAKAVQNRVGQCVMTCPSTNLFDAMPEAEKRMPLGQNLRFFGDGFQKSKLLGDRRMWRIPVMDGEFVVEEDFGIGDGVAGGNLIFGFDDKATALDILPKLVEEIDQVEGVVLPFPGGAVRSGSKVGSRYKGLIASTSHSFCPTLVGRPKVISAFEPLKMDAKINCVYEIVIDGESKERVEKAMKAGIQAAVEQDVPVVTAGNYGGKLGPYHFHLKDLIEKN